MSRRHANISIFVPHMGCPGRCSFCDQTKIACVSTKPTAEDVHRAVAEAKKSRSYNPKDTEIAFFGGSFTAIDEDYMLSLADAAKEHIDAGDVAGFRASTRPDAVTPHKLQLLKDRGLAALELGAQSMDDSVLEQNRRGHNSAAVEEASHLIRQEGISLGLQMMTGLLGDTDEGALYTASRIINIHPDTVRIYPTIVLKGTMLQKEMQKGTYKPQELEEAVELSAKLLSLFREADIDVIRIGLHEIDMDSYVAGPWHPAFGEMVESRLLLIRMEKEMLPGEKYIVFCNPKDVSKVIGQRRCNIEALGKKDITIQVAEDNTLRQTHIRIVKEK